MSKETHLLNLLNNLPSNAEEEALLNRFYQKQPQLNALVATTPNTQEAPTADHLYKEAMSAMIKCTTSAMVKETVNELACKYGAENNEC